MTVDGDSKPTDSSQETFIKLLDASLQQRLSADKWDHFLRQLLSQTHSTIAFQDILLDETRLNTSLTDPLYPSYIAKALSTRLLPPANVLSSLSKILPELQSAQQVAQYALLRVLAQAIPSWRPSPTSVDDIALLWSLVRLVHRFTSEEAFAQDHIIFIETIEAWKYMLKAQSLRRLFKFEKEKNTDSWRSFENEYQQICAAAAAKLPLSKLQGLENILNGFQMDLASVKGVAAEPVIERPKIPVLQTRAALVILLITMRETISLGKTDELWQMIDRSAEDASGRDIFQSLILAGFDALSVVLKRSDMTISTFQDPISEVNLYQSILVNRIPALLAARREQYSLPSEEIEILVLDIFTALEPALMTLNVPSLPNLDEANPDELSLPTKDYRHNFMYAMVKFGFLDSQAPSRMLGIQLEEIPPLIEVKEIMDDASDFMDEEGAIARIIERLGKLDGNQSVTVAAISELVQSWCSSHSLQSLAMFCSGLMKDPTLIEQMFLHTPIPSIIEPIRDFLDTWTIDEEDDNGEYQLIYAQYNSILFFVCYCVHHFGREVVLQDPNGPGFVRTWLREFSKSKWLDMLSDDDSNAIGNWITALFDGDGISGISDDLVRTSPPSKWLRISTTLFQQCVSAYRQGVFQLKTLQDGFEHFMHPFLEPCLLGAIQYLTTQIKTSPPDHISAYFEILSSLLSILSPPTQDDDIFSTDQLEPAQSRVLQILSPTIISTLSQLTLDQATPAKHLIDPIIETLRPYSTHFRPSPIKPRKQIIVALRTSQSRLAQWSAGWNEGFAVPAGIDLRCIPVAVKSCGASVVIRHIVAEMWAAEGTYSFHAVVAAAMFLTASFDVGFGLENLGERYLFMVPEEEGKATTMGAERSFGALTGLVKRFINWQDTKDGTKETNDAMAVDS